MRPLRRSMNDRMTTMSPTLMHSIVIVRRGGVVPQCEPRATANQPSRCQRRGRENRAPTHGDDSAIMEQHMADKGINR